MSRKSKAISIQITAAVMACLTVFIVILYARGVFDFTFIERPDTETDAPVTDSAPIVTEPAPEGSGTEKIDQILPAPENNDDQAVVFPEYSEAVGALPAVWAAKSEGKALYEGLYTRGNTILARVTEAQTFSDHYALRDMSSTEVVPLSTNWAGTVKYGESAVTVPRPVLQVYFGYILWDDGRTIKLCNSEGNVLLNDISAYEPVGYRDLAGHPLFRKDGIYYYYFDGYNHDPDTIFADQITPETIFEYPAEQPACYPLITAETEFTPVMPTAAGMVECTVDENYFNTVRLNSSYEEMANKDPESFRLCERRITKTLLNQAEIDARNALIADQRAAILRGELPADTILPEPVEPVYQETDEGTFWGFIDKNGGFVHYPQFARAYDYTTDGLAVISDPSDESGSRLCAINKSGVRMVDAVRNYIHLTDGGTATLIDGNHFPDTLGQENVGMLTFSNSLMRVRRRLINTSAGYTVYDDYTVLVDTDGRYFNTPAGYELVSYSDGVLLLEKNGYYGFMDRSGRWIAQPKYTYAQPFSEGLAVLGFASGARCMIDTKGNIVLPMAYTHISQCSNGVVVAFAEGHGWTVYNKMSTEKYTEQSNPIIAIKRRILAQQAYDNAQTAPDPIMG